MAKATRMYEEVVVKQEAPTGVHLQLTNEEAGLLLTILKYVGGDPGLSPRGLADSVRHALHRLGANLPNYDHLVWEDDRLVAVWLLPFSEAEGCSTDD